MLFTTVQYCSMYQYCTILYNVQYGSILYNVFSTVQYTLYTVVTYSIKNCWLITGSIMQGWAQYSKVESRQAFVYNYLPVCSVPLLCAIQETGACDGWTTGHTPVDNPNVEVRIRWLGTSAHVQSNGVVSGHCVLHTCKRVQGKGVINGHCVLHASTHVQGYGITLMVTVFKLYTWWSLL